MNYGIGNVKSKSGEIIANNGAYFVDLTNATESSGVYTIPSADIENGDFTLQVGDTLIDKDSGSMLKIATLTPSITASLVFEASGGGGKQLYQHNIYMYNSTTREIILTIENDNTTPIDKTALKAYLVAKGFTYYRNPYQCVANYDSSVYVGICVSSNDLSLSRLGSGTNIENVEFTINDTIIPK